MCFFILGFNNLVIHNLLSCYTQLIPYQTNITIDKQHKSIKINNKIKFK